MAYDPQHLQFRTQDPADWTHPVDLIEPEENHDDDPLDIEGIGQIPLDAITIILRTIVTRPPLSHRGWQAALCRLAVLAKTFDVGDLGCRSLSDIADDIGVSRALLSLRSCQLRDSSGGSCRGGKSNSARELYSERASSVWIRRKAAAAKLASAGGSV